MKPGEAMRAKVRVSVRDHRGRVLPKAQVMLRGDRSKVNLSYDEWSQSFVGMDVAPGDYELVGKAGRLQAESRHISVGPGNLTETLILGAKGLPFYFLGAVKVPFERHNLIGVTIDAGADAVLEGVAAALGARLEPVPDAVRADNVRVLRVDDDAALAGIIERVRELDVVRHAGQVVHLSEESVTYLTDELVVRFKSHVDQDAAVELVRRLGLQVERTIPYAGNALLVRSKAPATLELLDTSNRLAGDDMVEYAMPNFVRTMIDDAINPTDFLFAQQWHLPLIGMPDAWQTLADQNPNLTFGASNVVVAVMDRGIESTAMGMATTPDNDDFDGAVTSGASKIYQFFDFVNMVPNNDAPPNNHGMGCAGVAGPLANNASTVPGENEGVAGPAANCRFMGLIRPAGGTDVQYSDAYIWTAGFDPQSSQTGFPAQITPGADVITNSFGEPNSSSPISPLMQDVFDFLTTYGRGGKGTILFFSAGNGNTQFAPPRPWAAYEKTIAVAASTSGEVRASYSNFGVGIDVCAPSSGGPAPTAGIVSCDLVTQGNLAGHTGGSMDYTDSFGGTSAATPLTAGVAALMLSINPNLTWVEVREILRQTAVEIDFANVDPVGQWVDTDMDGVADYSQWYGYGRIDASAAVVGARDWGLPYELVVRENLADTGAVPAAGAFWNSPDIWVRRLSPAMDGAAAIPAGYNVAGPSEQALFAQDNWVWVRVRNVGSQPSLPFYVRVYLTHFAGTEFVYPQDFVPSNGPGVAPSFPLEPGTYLLGEVAHGPLAGGAEDNLNVLWDADLVPPQSVTVMGMDVTWHPCLLVEISPHEGTPALGNHVWDNNNLAQKNISIGYPDDDDGRFASVIVLGNRQNKSKQLELVIDRGKLPASTRMWVRFLDRRVHEQVRTNSEPHLLAGLHVSFPEASRVEISKPGDDQVMAISLPAGARIELTRRLPALGVEEFRPSLHLGQEVIFLPPDQQVHVPVPAGQGLVGVVVGGLVPPGTPPGRYEVSLTQLDQRRRVTGAAAIEVRVGERGGER